MKHLAAYLLLGLGGNTSPSAADVKAVLESVGVEADSDRLDKLIAELEGKDIQEVRLPTGSSRGFLEEQLLTPLTADCQRCREACFRPLCRRWWCRCRWCRCRWRRRRRRGEGRGEGGGEGGVRRGYGLRSFRLSASRSRQGHFCAGWVMIAQDPATKGSRVWLGNLEGFVLAKNGRLPDEEHVQRKCCVISKKYKRPCNLQLLF